MYGCMNEILQMQHSRMFSSARVAAACCHRLDGCRSTLGSKHSSKQQHLTGGPAGTDSRCINGGCCGDWAHMIPLGTEQRGHTDARASLDLLEPCAAHGARLPCESGDDEGHRVSTTQTEVPAHRCKPALTFPNAALPQIVFVY